MFMMIEQPNYSFGEKKTTFVLWETLQLIKLIYMNHNKYLSFFKSYNK
jgi:hypothetical protein